MQRKSGFLGELTRRRVLRTAGVYAIVAFVVAQVADLLLPALLLPDWAFRLVIALLILGFPIAIALAWSFDITPEGVRRTEPKRARDAPEGTGAEGDGAEAGAVEAGAPAVVPRFLLYAMVLVGLVLFVGALGYAGHQFMSVPGEPAAEGAPVPPPESGQSIAVLPLTNLAGGEENEYFADGITEDILTNLGLVPDFAVISRSSSMRYKGSDRSIRAIADELGVRYVLEGSLRRDGDRVRIVIQLVEPSTDRQIWAQTLDRRVEDVFAVQSEVAQAVVEALRVELTGGLEERMGRVPTDDFQAYELFLQGRDAYYRYMPQAMERAIERFEQATERDPDFALAHAWLGAAHAVSVFNFRADPTRMTSAERSARRAIELQPDLGDGYRALGTTLGISGRYAEATRALERAIELNPHDFSAIGNLGLMYALRGEWDRGIEIVLISIRRDPTRSYIDYANLGGYAARLGLFDRAREAIEQSMALNPENTTALSVLVLTELFAGRASEATDLATRLSGPGADAASLDAAGYAFAVLGEDARAREVLERLHEEAPDILPLQTHAPSVILAHLLDGIGEAARAEALLRESERRTREAMEQGDGNPAFPFSLAGIATIRGERGRAIGYLEQAVEMGWNDPIGTRIDPVLAPLHGDPRFEALMEGMEARVEAMRARVAEQR